MAESEDSLEILVYLSMFYFILFYFILFYAICSGMTGEHDTRDSNKMDGSTQH